MGALEYTPGEVKSLIAPIFNQDAGNIAHYIVICHTDDHKTLFTDSAVGGDGNEARCALMTAFNVSAALTDILGLTGTELGWAGNMEGGQQ